jgi:hypothetical protein
VVLIDRVGVNNDLAIDTGADSDWVTIRRTKVDELSVNLGGGVDDLEITDTEGRRARLDGGADNNWLYESNVKFSEAHDLLGQFGSNHITITIN